jgi:hypothetical protein
MEACAAVRRLYAMPLDSDLDSDLDSEDEPE